MSPVTPLIFCSSVFPRFTHFIFLSSLFWNLSGYPSSRGGVRGRRKRRQKDGKLVAQQGVRVSSYASILPSFLDPLEFSRISFIHPAELYAPDNAAETRKYLKETAQQPWSARKRVRGCQLSLKLQTTTLQVWLVRAGSLSWLLQCWFTRSHPPRIRASWRTWSVCGRHAVTPRTILQEVCVCSPARPDSHSGGVPGRRHGWRFLQEHAGDSSVAAQNPGEGRSPGAGWGSPDPFSWNLVH